MPRTPRPQPNPPAQAPPAKALYSFQKNAREEVRASLSRFHRRLYADLRVYVEDVDGQPRPTRKGLTVDVELLDHLAAAVAALRRAADEHDEAAR